MHVTTRFIDDVDITLMKSLCSLTGLCSCSGNPSIANDGPTGTLYVSVIVSFGTATVPAAHLPAASGNRMCVRWLALSVLLPSQQLANSAIRVKPRPFGQSVYLSVLIRFVNP